MAKHPTFLDLASPIALDTPVEASRLTRGTPKTGVLVGTENSTKNSIQGNGVRNPGHGVCPMTRKSSA